MIADRLPIRPISPSPTPQTTRRWAVLRPGLPLLLSLVLTILAAMSTRGALAATAGQDGRALVVAAQEAYDRGVELKRLDPNAAREAFEDAAAGFEEALRIAGPNGELWFNLGNAQLQIGDVGRAIHAFRNAELLLGSTPRVQASLSYARSLREDRIPSQGGRTMLRQVLDARMLLSPSLRLVLALAANALFWGLLAVRLVRTVPWSSLLATGLAAAILVASVLMDVRDWRAADAGVLVRGDVVLRTGNGESFGPAINERLGSGVEVRILEQRPGWLRIELPDGKEGWVQEAMVGRVGDVQGASGAG